MLTARQEATHVRHLAKTARPHTESPYIATLNFEDYSTEIKLVERIHEEISKGNPVVLKGYPYTEVEMSKDSIPEKLGIPLHREFPVLGKQRNFGAFLNSLVIRCI
jgi:hypothetical protein